MTKLYRLRLEWIKVDRMFNPFILLILREKILDGLVVSLDIFYIFSICIKVLG